MYHYHVCMVWTPRDPRLARDSLHEADVEADTRFDALLAAFKQCYGHELKLVDNVLYNETTELQAQLSAPDHVIDNAYFAVFEVEDRGNYTFLLWSDDDPDTGPELDD